jgi:hypothetical protein
MVAQSMRFLICVTKVGLRRLESDPDLAWVSTLGHWLCLSEPQDIHDQVNDSEKLPLHRITEANITDELNPESDESGIFAIYEGVIRLALASALISAYCCYVSTSATERTPAPRLAIVSLALQPLAIPWWILKNHRLACTLGWILWMNFNILFLFQFVTAMLERLILSHNLPSTESVVRTLCSAIRPCDNGRTTDLLNPQGCAGNARAGASVDQVCGL